eukprot:g5262.t1
MPGLLSRFARPPALPYQDYHDDGAAQEDSSGSVAGDSVAPTPDAPTLRKFYRDMRGKGWRRQHGWSTPDDDAEQVYMDEFDGSFPPCVKELRALEELDLSRNAFYGPIPNDVELWRLPGLRRLQLSNNRFSGRIPNELKKSKTLELLDCSNNNISDCLPAWACIGALHASASDPHPSEVLVMMMDAPPVLMLMQDEAIREANARLRATAWMRSHLAIEEHGRPHARHLGRVGVTLVELPQSKSASILKFGEMEQLPKAVLGAPVDGAQVSGDDFPHMVVAVNTDTAATARACGDHGPLQPPHPTFIVQGDELFDGSMKAFHEQVIKRNKAFGIVVGETPAYQVGQRRRTEGCVTVLEGNEQARSMAVPPIITMIILASNAGTVVGFSPRTTTIGGQAFATSPLSRVAGGPPACPSESPRSMIDDSHSQRRTRQRQRWGGFDAGPNLGRWCSTLLLGSKRSSSVRLAATAATAQVGQVGGPWRKRAAVGGGLGGREQQQRQRRRTRRPRQPQQRPPGWELFQAVGGGTGNDRDSRAGGDDEPGCLLFGDPEGELGGRGGDDFDDEEVVEVDEEELREEWIARGLDPDAFDPLTLLRMWEEEDQEEEDDIDRETINAMVKAAPALSPDRPSLPKGSARVMKERRAFQGMDGDGGDGEGDEDDVDAVMRAAAAVAVHKDRSEKGGDKSTAQREAYPGGAEALPIAGAGAERGAEANEGSVLEGRAVGIDLGTTNSAVAVIVDGQPVMVPNARGRFTTPSVVSFKVRGNMTKGSSSSPSPTQRQREPAAAAAAARGSKRRAPATPSSDRDLDYNESSPAAAAAIATEGGEGSSKAKSTRQQRQEGLGDDHGGGGSGGGGLARIYVGEAAAARIATHPKTTYSSVKRIVGRTKKQAKEAGVGLGALNVDQSQPYLRLKCPAIGDGATIPPEHLSAEILRALIRDAERFMGGGAKVKRAVVAVPAYFNPAQCAATERAGHLAGLDKVKLMREPEAAALAYGLDKGGDELILVFDLGGGTFDVSVLEVGGGIAEVIATAGDAQLGGDDFDQAVTEWLFDEVVDLGGGDPRSSPVATRQLLEAARGARERLSDASETEVELTFADGNKGHTTLTRAKMESLIVEPLKRIMAPMREVAIMADVSLPGDTGAFMDYSLEDSRELRASSGGGGAEAGGERESLRKLRSAQSKARKKARAQSKSVRRQVASMAEVARGMDGSSKLRRFPQGGRMVDKVVLVGGATRMPCVQRLVGGITGVKPKRTVDPDRAVALGAAAFAGILEGEVEGQEVMTSWQASIYRMMARDGMMP